MAMTETKIVLKRSGEDYPADVTRVQTVVTNHGYECSRQQADDLWQAYSSSLCAGWIMPDPYSDEAIWEVIKAFAEL